jgi:hypothetical protein
MVIEGQHKNVLHPLKLWLHPLKSKMHPLQTVIAPPPNRNCTPLTGFYQNYGSLPKKPEKSRFFGLFFFALLLKIGSKLWKEQPVFWKEQGDFGHFGVFEPKKSVLSVII